MQKRIRTAILLALVLSPLFALTAPARHRTKAPVVYTNRRYGLRFNLPPSWKGYSIEKSEWMSLMADQHNTPEHVDLLLLSIRHPLWTEEHPREDIPIMIFTRRQWSKVVQSRLVVSPAPFPPSEIGRNERYVFAAPPRFFYDLLDGYEEVLKILQGRPVRTFRPAGALRHVQQGPTAS